MVDPLDILLGGVLPGLVACSCLWMVAKSTGNAASGWRTAAVAAFTVGIWALDARELWSINPGWNAITEAISNSLRIREAKDFLPLVAMAGILPDMLASYGGGRRIAAWVMRGLLCVGLPWRLLAGSSYLPSASAAPNPFNTSAWSTGEAVAWLGGIGASLCLVWATWRAGRKETPRLRGVLVAIVCLAASLAMAMSGSLSYGQLFGVITAAATGGVLVAWLASLDRGPEAAAGPLILAFGGVIVLGHFFAELKLVNAILLITALAAAGGWCFPRLKHSAWLRGVLCLILVGIAVGGAAADFRATQQESAENPYSQFME